MAIFLKDPAARLDYAVDWSATSGSATIVASDWLVEPADPAGLTVGALLVEPARTGATFAGGVAGTVYRIANRVTLSDGRRDERSLSLRVEDR